MLHRVAFANKSAEALHALGTNEKKQAVKVEDRYSISR